MRFYRHGSRHHQKDKDGRYKIPMKPKYRVNITLMRYLFLFFLSLPCLLCKLAPSITVPSPASTDIGPISVCLQKHRPGEIEAAIERVKFKKGKCILYYHRRLLNDIGGPPILFIGDSYINHLKSYASSLRPPMRAYQALKRSYFLGVGGTTWDRAVQDWNGVDLKPLQIAGE